MKFVGDAVMAVFNAPARQPDHALRAARAALGMQEAIKAVAVGDPDLPRFRVGVMTGPALVGNIGSEETRDYTVIGDAVNLAARLEGSPSRARSTSVRPPRRRSVTSSSSSRSAR